MEVARRKGPARRATDARPTARPRRSACSQAKIDDDVVWLGRRGLVDDGSGRKQARSATDTVSNGRNRREREEEKREKMIEKKKKKEIFVFGFSKFEYIFFVIF